MFYARVLHLHLYILQLAVQLVSGGARANEPACDVLVAGGSLASLAAAVAAANASLALSPSAPASVCLLEITDWLGGQATASGTSAIDLGATWDNFPTNFPAAFAAFLLSPPLGPAGHNPGGCTVSQKCFLPALFVAWADALVATLPNLRVYVVRTKNLTSPQKKQTLTQILHPLNPTKQVPQHGRRWRVARRGERPRDGP
jgi:hypothetical protein